MDLPNLPERLSLSSTSGSRSSERMASNESPNSESRGRMSHSAKRPIKRYSDVSSDGVRVRQMARFLTGGFEPAPRRFDTEITPAELAELHALHQSFVRSAPEVVDNRKTAFATGDDNSWMICPDIPNDSEGPFEPRDFTLSPLGTRPMKLLAKVPACHSVTLKVFFFERASLASYAIVHGLVFTVHSLQQQQRTS